MKAYERFDEILTIVYFLNGISILDVKFTNLVPLWRHLCGWRDISNFPYVLLNNKLSPIQFILKIT